ncbi:putative iron transport lipoprotein [Streptomyces ambofaciens ATCC 23877]|uniref:Putative iron transport lipoprotein n=1 Tax=Streptomyces ambofaciens (strain ATCC 23877 / 3486 / DSM 40053 / JCM 4204 / NBRC 12836 / NRRL B-2516) TaxID=278992 RepID=A3KIF0_STRA7|nr:ABC transporter substrate-binding protein [Streptomyces ambofaciens]AKZ53603.1 putative iron transport lipoprotein [Streptomyces ambofaciens ATCC 23877]CAJ89481.1 putative iron transport lipoprotein [Streptomyces ambofaciens ATCC 23877]
MPDLARPLALALALALALTGCGADVSSEKGQGDEARPSDGHYPVTVENCGEKKTFDSAPRRVVTNDVGITEIMFALGLEDHMAGYVMPDDKGDLATVPWKDGYRKTEWLSKDRINKELVLDARADLVFAGWNYGFNEGEGFTPDALRRVGIDSYLLTESCRNGQGEARGVMAPLDALYTDLRNLGRVFDVEDRAESLIRKFRRQVADAQAGALRGADRPRVFLYDGGEDKPFTSGAYAGPHDIITKAGGDHVMKDLKDSWTTVGWETVVDRDPEVIVINDYGDVTAEQKRKFLMTYKPLADVSAIRNDRIVVLDYVDLVESPRNPAAISSLAEELRSLGRREG